MLNADGTKTCPSCSLSKLPANFYRTGRPTGDGLSGYCILCTKEKAKEWQKALSEDRRTAKNARDWERVKRDPERLKKAAEGQARWRAKPGSREKMNQWSKAYKERDPERRRLQNAISNNRARAKRLGLPNTFQYVDWCQVLESFEHACAFCGTGGCLLDLEHLVPMTRGGPNAWGNVVPACRPCNAQKNGRTLEEFAALRGISPEVLQVIRAKAARHVLPSGQ